MQQNIRHESPETSDDRFSTFIPNIEDANKKEVPYFNILIILSNNNLIDFV
jgi:hypothetical protein